MVPPEPTAAGPVLTTERSADGKISVSTESSLLVESGSGVVAVMSTSLVMVPVATGAVTTMVNTVLEPAGQLTRSQLTEMFPLFVQVQPKVDAFTETNVTPAGSVSVIEAFAALDGPLLVAVTW